MSLAKEFAARRVTTAPISRPGVGRSRAVRVQQAGVKTDHSQPRQIGPRSMDGGSVSDSQADSAGSIPVTRSTREKRCSTDELDGSSPPPIRASRACAGHCGPHLSTPRHSPFRFRRRSACSVMLSGSPTAPRTCFASRDRGEWARLELRDDVASKSGGVTLDRPRRPASRDRHRGPPRCPGSADRPDWLSSLPWSVESVRGAYASISAATLALPPSTSSACLARRSSRMA